MKIHFDNTQDVMINTKNGLWVKMTIIPKLLFYGTSITSGTFENDWLLEFQYEIDKTATLIYYQTVAYPLSKIKPVE